ncbi:MAG: hypothetical protein HY089_12700 [Ignavibacteriales bacterium]|nr:hypothetical protein [Ignavibacteriales bacterium]
MGANKEKSNNNLKNFIGAKPPARYGLGEYIFNDNNVIFYESQVENENFLLK